MNFLNIFLNSKSKHVIKGAIPEIEKKQNELICKSNPSETYEQNIRNKIKQKKKLYPENANFNYNKFFHKY